MTLYEYWIFVQQALWSGLVTGSVYGLLAIAIVTVFKTTDVPNFAQGEMFMVAGYVGLYLLVTLTAPYAVTVVAAIVLLAIVSGAFQRVVMERVVRAQGSIVQLVITTLGFAYLLKGVVRLTGLGDTPRSLPALVSTASVQIGDASLTHLDLVILATAVGVMLALYGLFAHTRQGKAMRAVGMNPKAAQVVGIRLQNVRMGVWALAGVISAVAALLITPKLLITPDIAHIAILAYAAAIVGGITSLPGAVVGGVVIGIFENLVGIFVSTNAIVIAPFLAILTTLVVRPQGIFGGKPQAKKV